MVDVIEVLVESGVGIIGSMSCCDTSSIDHTAILISIAYCIICYCPRLWWTAHSYCHRSDLAEGAMIVDQRGSTMAANAIVLDPSCE